LLTTLVLALGRCKSLPLSLQEGRVIIEREAAEKAAADAASPPPALASGSVETGAAGVKEEAESKPQTISVVGEDGKEVEERVIPEFGIRMGLPDDVDLMIEAKGASCTDRAFLEDGRLIIGSIFHLTLRQGAGRPAPFQPVRPRPRPSGVLSAAEAGARLPRLE
jgi:hypothetical protein